MCQRENDPTKEQKLPRANMGLKHSKKQYANGGGLQLATKQKYVLV